MLVAASARLHSDGYGSCRQLNALLLRWTSADTNSSGPDGGKGGGDENSAAGVAAGLRLVRAVCTKAENNKGK